MKIKSKCKLIFAYINAMSLSCIFGVALEYLSGKGFAEKLIEAILIEEEKEEK